MNERIKQLAEQASKEAFPLGSIAWMETFAELIINESIKIMMENDYHGEWLGEKIKEHFGKISS